MKKRKTTSKKQQSKKMKMPVFMELPGFDKQNKPNIFVILLMLFLGWAILSSFLFTSERSNTVALSDIAKLIEENQIEKVEYSDTLVKAYPKNGDNVLQANILPNNDFLTFLQERNLEDKVSSVEAIRPLNFLTSLSSIANILFLVLMAFLFFNIFKSTKGGGPGGIFDFGKSRAKLFQKGAQKSTTFNDVAVSDEIKEEMYELVDFLKNPEKYRKVGARIPKGVLLVGPAGVGKTLIARAIAGEADVKFYSAAGSEFMEMLVGVGSARVRDMFTTAKQTSPSLIFIDEIDAIGRQRGMGIGGGHDEREQTLNQILVEMDGFDKNINVIVIAATNRPDMLDPALVRPGRFDRKITLSMPTLEDRVKIVNIHLQGKPLAKDVNVDQIAKRTVGFSGADIENMLNEAAILAARNNRDIVTFKDISEAATKVKLGPERKKLQNEEEKKITAYHEAGHAIVAHYLDKVDPVRRISIVARTQTLGHTDISSEREEYNYNREKLIQMISVMFGGRVAEEVFFNEQSIGASNDIERATDIARRMVTEWGMSKLGPINYSKSEDRVWLAKQVGRHVDYSEKTAEQIDIEVNKIIEESKKVAEKIIKKNAKALEKVSSKLLEIETMEQNEFEEIVGEKSKKPESGNSTALEQKA